MKENKSTNNYSDDERQFESITGDANTADYYQQDDSKLEERNDDEDIHENVVKKSNKTKVIIGAAVVGVVAVAGTYFAISDDEPTPQPQVERKSNNIEKEVKMPEIEDSIKINESLKEVPQPPAPIINDHDATKEVQEPKEIFNIEPPKIEEQSNIFKDIEKPIQEKVENKIPEIAVVDPVLTDPVIDKPIETPTLGTDTPIAPILPKVEDKPIVAEITPEIKPEISIQEKETVDELIIPTETNQGDLGNTLIEPTFEEDVKINNDESMVVLIKELNQLSNNIKEMNKTLTNSQDQILVNKSDIQKLMDRVTELEKLHKDGKGGLVACQSTCNTEGAITKIAPVKEVKKKVVKKPEYKPANKVQVVSKSGDLAKSKPVAKKASSSNNNATNSRILKLESVVGDRAWVRTQDGSIRSYSINDRLPNGKVIGNVDSRTGVFDINGHLILSK